ncbi:MAG: hypothetical protein AB7O62_00195 [Pirellulales bacterium]
MPRTTRQTWAQACFQFACEFEGWMHDAVIGGRVFRSVEVRRTLLRRQQPAVCEYTLIIHGGKGRDDELFVFGDEGQVRQHIPPRRRG